MEILQIFLLVFFVIIALLLVLIVLLQDDQGEGLAGMFSGGSSSTFGSRSGNILTKTTSIFGALFMISAVILALLFKTPTAGDVSAAARQSQPIQEWWNEPAPADSTKKEENPEAVLVP